MNDKTIIGHRRRRRFTRFFGGAMMQALGIWRYADREYMMLGMTGFWFVC